MQGASEVPSKVEVTQLLKAWGTGGDRALERLDPVVENELHRIARRCMAREWPGRTLQTTALVKEVYLRLVDVNAVDWPGPRSFFLNFRPHEATHLARFCAFPELSEARASAVQVSFDEALIVTPEKDGDTMSRDETLKELPYCIPGRVR